MKSVQFDLQFDELPPDHLFGEFCAEPALDRELILGGHATDTAETNMSFVYGDPAAYRSLLEQSDEVVEYDITEAKKGFYLYYRRDLRESELSLLDAFTHESIVLVPPVEARSDGSLGLTLVGDQADLQAFFDALPPAMTHHIHRIREGLEAVQPPLSPDQREALSVAWEAGYYDVPRQNGIEAVAAELDCAVSTASEVLRRGEANLVRYFLDLQAH